MQLKRLKVSGCLNEDGSIDFAASLVAFTLDDERKDMTRITRLLDKKVRISLMSFYVFFGIICEQPLKFVVFYEFVELSIDASV